MSFNRYALVALGVCASVAHAGVTTIDFSTDDGGNVLVDGQDISSPPEFGNIINISSSGPNLGAAIFDSDPLGPNMGGPDPDLLVDLGNILILQSNDNPTQTVPGIFDTPNDDLNGGVITFDFKLDLELLSIDLVDINGNNQSALLTLTDANNLTRVYDVPSLWTNDISVGGPDGFQTLDLTTLADQLGEGGSTATASEDLGFDPTSVTQLTVDFEGSAGLDNLVFIPAPGSAGLLALAGLCAARRRRV